MFICSAQTYSTTHNYKLLHRPRQTNLTFFWNNLKTLKTLHEHRYTRHVSLPPSFHSLNLSYYTQLVIHGGHHIHLVLIRKKTGWFVFLVQSYLKGMCLQWHSNYMVLQVLFQFIHKTFSYNHARAKHTISQSHKG